MMHLTALLTARDGVAVLAALTDAATTSIAAGDPRTRDQIMADTLVARVTGREPITGSTPVTVNLIITDRALLTDATGSSAGASLQGYGPVPADLAHEIAAQAGTGDAVAPVWLRRLYTHPGTGELIAMESRQRLFPAGLATFIRLRDRSCRTPWCNAPIRHIDHVVPHADGGPTTATNGQGLCTACNHAKQAPGWHARPAPGTGRHTVITTTPTGHTYTGTSPPLAG
jgi:hypothetical protein